NGACWPGGRRHTAKPPPSDSTKPGTHRSSHMPRQSLIRIASATSAAALVAGLAACSSSASSSGSSSSSTTGGSSAVSNSSSVPTVTLMVGGIDKQIYLPYQLAQDLGFYKKYGVN